MRSPNKRQALKVVLALVAALLAAPAATAEPTVASKETEAQHVLAQIRQIDLSMQHAVEAYNAATVRLERIERAQRDNRQHLVIARSNLKRSQAALSGRLVQIYTSGDALGGLGVLLGATSLNDFLNGVEAEDSVSRQDARIVREVRTFKAAVQRHARELKRAHTDQSELVAERAAQKAHISSQLVERQSLLSSIRGEIARLRASEQARQLALNNQARARVAGQPAPSAEGSVIGASAGTAEAVAAPPSTKGGVVGIAMSYLGVPYRWGGASPSGFDCSGLVIYAFGRMGVSLPHSTYALWGMGVPVGRGQLAPGDLVFFNGLGHMGIYIGGNQFVHAPHTGDVVKVSSMSGWYASTYMGARRIP